MQKPKCKVCKQGLKVPKSLYQTRKGNDGFCSEDCLNVYYNERKKVKESNFKDTRCPYCGEIEPFIGCRCQF